MAEPEPPTKPPLVEKEVTVHRGGTTFQEKRMVRAGEPGKGAKEHRLGEEGMVKLKEAIAKHINPKYADKVAKAILQLNEGGLHEGSVLVVPAAFDIQHTTSANAAKNAIAAAVGAKTVLRLHTPAAEKAVRDGKLITINKEGPELPKEKWDEYNSKLSTDEQTALKDWTTGNFPAQRKRFVDGALNQRDKDLVSALEKAPDYGGVVYRGMTGADLIAKLEAAGEGGEWSDVAPASHSRSYNMAWEFSQRGHDKDGVIFVVKSKTMKAVEGADGVPKTIKNRPPEKEVVSLPGQKFKITKVHRNKLMNGRIISCVVEMEEA